MQIRSIPSNRQISRRVNQVWLLNNEQEINRNDLCSIIPNGSSKLLIALDNQVEIIDSRRVTVIKPETYYFIGLRTTPIRLNFCFTNTRVLGIDIPLSKVEENGGKVVLEKTNIGEFGNIGLFMDTEGNFCGLHSFE